MPTFKKPTIVERAARSDVASLAEIERQMQLLGEQQVECKKRVTQYILDHVPPDENGHRKWMFEEPIGNYEGIVYQRRAPQRFDLEIAKAILTKKDLLDECMTIPEPVPYLDEDKVVALAFVGRLPDKEVQKMYVTDESYAFVPKRLK